MYVRSGKRTKTAAARISLHAVGWSADHLRVFESCQTALANATTLAHPSPDKRVCLYTDASQDFWSAIATQVPPSDLNLSPKVQRHEPLAFLSGRFTGAMSRWPIIEKRPMLSLRVEIDSNGSYNVLLVSRCLPIIITFSMCSTQMGHMVLIRHTLLPSS